METTQIFHVKGMFCNNCEKRINSALLSLDGVRNVYASFEKETVEVTFDPDVADTETVRHCIEAAGYEVSGEKSSHLKIIAILSILFTLWMIAQYFDWTQMFSIIPEIETTLSIGALFVIGLLTSVHCAAMCGGMNLTQSVMASSEKKLMIRSNVRYQTGRIISYTLIGGAAGGIGQVLNISSKVKGMIMIIAGLAILLMALNMLGLFRSLSKILFRIRRKIPGKGFNVMRFRKKANSSFVIGLLNGLMPCGPLQSMQIYALSTGSLIIT